MSLFKLERSAVIALTVACALFMENLDGTVIATALPQIAESFAVSPVHLSLAITSYLLSVAIFIPASGWTADRFGARTVFRAAIPVSILIENHKEPETPPFDLVGFILSAVALVGVMSGFEAIGRGGVPLAVALLLVAIGLAAAILYLRHASRHPNPIIDLLLFRIPTFAIAVGGGALFRIGIGALPFLLPLLLQLGFGMTAFASGMLTFASAVGALAMKITARPILRRWGFRNVMIGNALIGSAFLLSYATFRPGVPSAIILVLLLAGGFFRSLQFTSTNTLAFAAVPPTRISRATSLTSTAQPLSVSMGVALGATLLHLTLLCRGTEQLTPTHFVPALVALSLISSSSVFVYARLAPDAGAEVSGHGLVAPPAPVSKGADD